jgi:hypothetical protein
MKCLLTSTFFNYPPTATWAGLYIEHHIRWHDHNITWFQSKMAGEASIFFILREFRICHGNNTTTCWFNDLIIDVNGLKYFMPKNLVGKFVFAHYNAVMLASQHRVIIQAKKYSRADCTMCRLQTADCAHWKLLSRGFHPVSRFNNRPDIP